MLEGATTDVEVAEKEKEKEPREGFVGNYSPEARKERIEKFHEKRKNRMWSKKVKYDVRKNFADSRIRIKVSFLVEWWCSSGFM